MTQNNGWEPIGAPPSMLRYQVTPTYQYEVDLEEMESTAAVLDWIVQVSKKTWATPAVVGELVRSIDQVLNLQANYCSQGIEARRPNE